MAWQPKVAKLYTIKKGMCVENTVDHHSFPVLGIFLRKAYMYKRYKRYFLNHFQLTFQEYENIEFLFRCISNLLLFICCCVYVYSSHLESEACYLELQFEPLNLRPPYALLESRKGTKSPTYLILRNALNRIRVPRLIICISITVLAGHRNSWCLPLWVSCWEMRSG